MYLSTGKRRLMGAVERFGRAVLLSLIICLIYGHQISAAFASHHNKNQVTRWAELNDLLKNEPGLNPFQVNGFTLYSRIDTTEKVFSFVEQMPVFPGGEAAQSRFIKMNLRYPAEAMKAGITGLVVAQFVVDKKGKIQHIGIAKSVSQELDEEVMRIVRLMPDFEPAVQNGQPVSFRYTLPVRFSLATNDMSDGGLDTLKTRIFTFAETPPRFPGGEPALQAFLKDNLKIPAAGRKNHAQKYVLVQFIIDDYGNLFYPKVINSAGKEMDEEALRVVKLLPAFIPAKQNNKTVAFKYTLPIRFYK